MIDSLDFLRLFGGIVYLVVGGDLLVRGAIGMSRRLSISPLVVGMTVVALGTSAPELVVSIHSALSGHGALSIGTVVGSNIANVLLALGAPALIYAARPDASMRGQASFMVGVSVLFVLLCRVGPLSWPHGALMLAVLATGMFLTARGVATMPGVDVDEAEEELKRALGLPHVSHMIVVFLLLGSAALALGADLTVEGAVNISRHLEVSEAVVGATLVAIGTSLPELATTLIAALHRSSDVAFGNVIGSNVLNILGIMGLTAIVVEVPVPASLLAVDLWFMLGTALLLWVLVARSVSIGRLLGVGFLLAYGVYLGSVF